MTYLDNHHDDGRVAYLGWIGVRLDRDLSWDGIATKARPRRST